MPSVTGIRMLSIASTTRKRRIGPCSTGHHVLQEFLGEEAGRIDNDISALGPCETLTSVRVDRNRLITLGLQRSPTETTTPKATPRGAKAALISENFSFGSAPVS